MHDTSTSQPKPQASPPNTRRAFVGRALAAPALMTVCSGSAFAAASHLRCLVNANTPATASNPPAGIQVGANSALDSFVRVQLWAVTTLAMREAAGPKGSMADAAPPTAPGLGADTPPPGINSDKSAPSAQADLPRTGSTLPIDGTTILGTASVVGGGVDSRTQPVPGLGAPGGQVQPNSGGGAFPTITTYYVRGQDLPNVCRTATSSAPTLNKWQVIDVTNYTPGILVGPIQTGPQQGQASLSNHWVIIRFDQTGCIASVGNGSGGAAVGNSCWASVVAGPRP